MYKRQAKPSDAPQFMAIAVDPQGQLFIGDEAVPQEAFIARIGAAGKANPQLEVQLRADRSVPYGRVAEVLGWVQQAGLSRIGFITEAPPAPR